MYKTYDKSERCDLFYVKYTKTLSFSLVVEALMGLTYHRPVGENCSFSSGSRELGRIRAPRGARHRLDGREP